MVGAPASRREGSDPRGLARADVRTRRAKASIQRRAWGCWLTNLLNAIGDQAVRLVIKLGKCSGDLVQAGEGVAVPSIHRLSILKKQSPGTRPGLKILFYPLPLL